MRQLLRKLQSTLYTVKSISPQHTRDMSFCMLIIANHVQYVDFVQGCLRNALKEETKSKSYSDI